MLGFSEKSLVWRVTVGPGDAVRVYESCWIVVDHRDQVVHLWTDPDEGVPSTTAPLASTLIEWKKP